MYIHPSFNTSLSSLKILPYINEASTKTSAKSLQLRYNHEKPVPYPRTDRMHFPSAVPIMSRESPDPALLRVQYGNLGLPVPFRAA
jgi:hypothetical protein